MGYRSDVRALVYGPTDKINALVARHAMSDNVNVFESWLKNHIEFEEDEGITVIQLKVESVKWYSGYEDVAAWHEFMGPIDNQPPDDEVMGYEFVRIGENVDDIEYSIGGNVEDRLYVRREIARNF